jgi:hypothetical protein
MLLVSTDSTVDLSIHNDSLIAFSRELPGCPEEQLLEHPHRWFVGSREGCSCGFRHLYVASVDLGFGEPVDWYPEEGEDIEATIRFIRIVRELVAEGVSVDCIDAWPHGEEAATLSGTIHVDLPTTSDRAFRFYENHRFVFEAASNDSLQPRTPSSRR